MSETEHLWQPGADLVPALVHAGLLDREASWLVRIVGPTGARELHRPGCDHALDQVDDGTEVTITAGDLADAVTDRSLMPAACTRSRSGATENDTRDGVPMRIGEEDHAVLRWLRRHWDARYSATPEEGADTFVAFLRVRALAPYRPESTAFLAAYQAHVATLLERAEAATADAGYRRDRAEASVEGRRSLSATIADMTTSGMRWRAWQAVADIVDETVADGANLGDVDALGETLVWVASPLATDLEEQPLRWADRFALVAGPDGSHWTVARLGLALALTGTRHRTEMLGRDPGEVPGGLSPDLVAEGFALNPDDAVSAAAALAACAATPTPA